MDATVTADGLDEAIALMQTAAQMPQRLVPELVRVAQTIQADTLRTFEDRQSVVGENWPRLAQSTIDARQSKSVKSGRRKFARKFVRSSTVRAYVSAGSDQPLVRTGELRREAGHIVANATSISMTIPGYGVPHMVGDSRSILAPRPPKRNFAVFVKVGGEWTLAPKYARLVEAAIIGSTLGKAAAA